MNRHMRLCRNRSETIHGPSDHIHNPAQAFLPDGHHNGRTHVSGLHAPDQTIRNVHGDAPDYVITQVLRYLDNKVIRFIVNRRVGDGDCVQDIGKLPLLKRHVYNRSNDLYNRSYIHTRLLQLCL